MPRLTAAPGEVIPNSAAEAAMIKQHGSANQRERYDAGLLPEDELTLLARDVLFEPFDEFRRWFKLRDEELRHEHDCSSGRAEFRTREVTSLTHDEWSTFKKITTAASLANNGVLARHGVTATATLVEHVGGCSVCGAEIYGRSVAIKMIWAGRVLSREYTLESGS